MVRSIPETGSAISTLYNAVITPVAQEAQPGPGLLAGLRVVVKDNIDTQGVRTTHGSSVFARNVPNRDATVVTRLRDAGAAVVGKANLDEFALGTQGQNQHWGACVNQWSPERIPGGSSGGSAVAVAAGLCEVSLGTDTGGSVRVPAAFTHVLGLRPTFGLLPVEGVFPASPSFDTVGLFARDARLLARTLSALSPEELPFVVLSPSEEARPVRVGVPEAFFFDDVDPGVLRRVHGVVGTLRALGCHVRDAAVPEPATAQEQMHVILYGEVARTHAHGLARHPQAFAPDIRRVIEAGSDIDDRAVADARRWREQWQAQLDEVFRHVDVLVTPTSPVDVPFVGAAPLLEGGRTVTRNTHVWSMHAGPSLSIPAGLHPDSGMPVGALLIAAPRREDLLIRVALDVLSATGHHRLWPPGCPVDQ